MLPRPLGQPGRGARLDSPRPVRPPTPPAKPHPSYSRLSRYDETGLIWLLQGRPVVALTEATAAIESPAGTITTYRRHNKPALGPVGDSLDDFEPPFGGAPHDRR